MDPPRCRIGDERLSHLVRIAQHLADGAVFLDHRDAAGVVAVAGAGGADDFSVRHVLDPVGSAWLPGSPHSIAEVGSQTQILWLGFFRLAGCPLMYIQTNSTSPWMAR